MTTLKIETITVDITLYDNGIAEFEAKPSMKREFNLEDIKEIIQLTKTFNHTNRLFLIHIRHGRYSVEARKYLGKQDEIADKVAMVATKPVQTMLGNFFLGIHRPQLDIKLFNSVQKAESWLLG